MTNNPLNHQPASDLKTLWIIHDNSQDKTWQDLDFNSAFLLSEIQRYRKSTPPIELNKLIEDINWPIQKFETQFKPWILVGCQNHFPAHWLLLIQDPEKFSSSDLEKVVQDLKIRKVKLYSKMTLSPSLKARLDTIETV